MAKPARRHRAALDDHTECGIPLERPDLSYQSAAGDDEPLTCRRCIRILTIYCTDCREETVRTRVRDTTPVRSERYPDGQPIDALQCHCGRTGQLGFQPVGQAAQKRRIKAQRAQARQDREASAITRRERLADAMAIEQAEYPHPDTCALCDEPLPKPLSELYGFHEFFNGFRASRIKFLPWYYCMEHRRMGEELDATLIANFKRDALEILAGVAKRVGRQADSPPLD